MIGLTSVTFRKLTCEEIIRLAQESEAQCIEWGGDVHVTDVKTAREVRQGCARAGIQTRSYGSYYKIGSGRLDRFRGLCEIAEALGARVIRVWLGEQGSRETSPEALARLVEEGRRLSGIAAEYGLTVASEFHRNTYNDTAETCLAYLRQCGVKNLKTYWQPMYAGADLENLRAVAGQTEVVHLFCWNQSGSRRYPLKKGEEEIGSFLRELRARGFLGDLLLEFVKGDSIRRYRRDMLCLKQLWEESAGCGTGPIIH